MFLSTDWVNHKARLICHSLFIKVNFVINIEFDLSKKMHTKLKMEYIF